MKKKKQSNADFLMECKIEDSVEKEIALKVRRQLASYIHEKIECIYADTKMMEIIDITDSLDIIDFTLILEGVFNRQVSPEEVNTLIGGREQYEEMYVEDYINKIICVNSC